MSLWSLLVLCGSPPFVASSISATTAKIPLDGSWWLIVSSGMKVDRPSKDWARRAADIMPWLAVVAAGTELVGMIEFMLAGVGWFGCRSDVHVLKHMTDGSFCERGMNGMNE